MTITAPDAPDLSRVTDCSSMFRICESVRDGNFGDWDISNVTDMSNMFVSARLRTKGYDEILKGWGARARDYGVQREVNFSAGNRARYSADAAADRQYLIDNYGWRITDGGEAP